MIPLERFRNLISGRTPMVLVGILLLVGIASEVLGDWPMSRMMVRGVQGFFMGHLPAPAEKEIARTMGGLLRSDKSYRLMVIRHIPRIDAGAPMPHPYVGGCTQCHLYRGGPGPGSQFKTPVGSVLESISQVVKLGPPLRPDSEIPHPPAGRCIKCHDIVVKVPVDRKRGDPLWVM